MLVGVIALAPAWRERARLAAISARLIDGQRVADRADDGARDDLMALATRLGGGRIYAGRPNN